MAYIGEWGCFIHIPKTGGVWVKTVLKNKDGKPGKYDGITHGLPVHWEKYDRVFACVRDPADYLASAWAHLWRNGWDTYPRRVPWQTFVELVRPYKTEDFDEFVKNITTHRRGIVTWLFSVYTPPPTTVLHTGEDTYKYLESIGYNPREIPKRNAGPNVPELTETHHRLIRESEKEAYVKWGF